MEFTPSGDIIMPSTSMSKILIVNDASFMRVVLKDVPISHDPVSQVCKVEDGLAEVESCKQLRPDIATTDINMPNTEGIQALKSITQGNQKAKAVMVTPVEQERIVQGALKSSARDGTVKPFDRSNIVMMINKVMKAR